jgi:hypothetical protein
MQMNVQVEYTRRITWNKIGKSFFNRTREAASKSASERKEVADKVYAEVSC